jgi:hypothetical protein
MTDSQRLNDLFNEDDIRSKAALGQFVSDGRALGSPAANDDLGLRRQLGTRPLKVASINQRLLLPRNEFSQFI